MAKKKNTGAALALAAGIGAVVLMRQQGSGNSNELVPEFAIGESFQTLPATEPGALEGGACLLVMRIILDEPNGEIFYRYGDGVTEFASTTQGFLDEWRNLGNVVQLC